MKTTKNEAIALIGGRVVEGYVLYYDDSTRRYYVGPASDLGDLCMLMDDPETEGDAYSHWCALTTHEGYATEAEALASIIGLTPCH